MSSRTSDSAHFWLLFCGLLGGTLLEIFLHNDFLYQTPQILITWSIAVFVYFLWKKPYLFSHKEGPKSWIMRWLMTTNHRDIGIMYILTSFYMAFVGGALAILMRAQLMHPNSSLLVGNQYNEAVSAHGLIMVLWFLSPFAFGLANYIVPLQIGAKDLAFPRLNAMSFWFYAFSCVLLISSFFLPGGSVNAGWTLYAPINGAEFMPGAGPTVSLLALLMLIASVTMTGVNFLVTVFTMRAPEITISKIPMFTWFIVFTVIQMVFAFPGLLAAALMLGMDRVAGMLFFTARGASMLWDNLFWYFGHPEVYIILLPAFGALAEIIPVFSGRRELYGKKVFLIATFTTVIPLSLFIWGHHVYTTILPLPEKEMFEVATEAISLPFGLMVFGFLWTLETGRIRLSTPMLFALGSLALFIIGGITGVFLSSIVLDQEFRGAYFVVAHFHYVMVGATLFGLFAALYYWFPKITGKMFSETLGKIHFALSFLLFNVTFFPMFFLYQMPRRIFTYNVESWVLPNFVASIGAFLFVAVQAIVVVNLVFSTLYGGIAPKNPWEAHTSEWQSDEALVTFSQTSRSQIKLSSLLLRLIFVPTTKNITIQNNQEIKEDVVVLEHVSSKPVTIAAGLTLFLFGFAILNYVFAGPIFVLGLLLTLYGLTGLARESLHAKFNAFENGLVEAWPFKGVTRLRLAVWIFLLSEVIMFTTILTSDTYLRMLTQNWPAINTLHPVLPGLLLTIVLLSGSLTGFLALNSAKNGNNKRGFLWLLVTVVLGSLFIIVEGDEWSQLFAQGLAPFSNNALSTYFFTTGVHMAHVLSAISVAVYLLRKLWVNKSDYEALEAWAIYWSFVDAIWVILYFFFYLG
ncbi:hypothetical protein B9Q12_02655 [Candidatus Marsarchaeota G2 archaeon ECH_B_SAG-G06]|uniref:Cytochrome C oxidase subunit I n=1 Tax=Candidatus Marsarchaeota G2 archaeon ECH_B_SAG-G06 TaxID=1978166 RepID=A0A2R6C0C2_9ARCH|nr:MAG: hypothetical protein B9Q12_02655 [Candidatus Marsarchaeota G2 archaeon ECH_B_SAG-G06]